MSSKKIVIKLNYSPNQAAQPASADYDSALQREWNIKRIVVALAAGIGVLAALGYVIFGGDSAPLPEAAPVVVQQHMEAQEPAPSVSAKPAIKPASAPARVESVKSTQPVAAQAMKPAQPITAQATQEPANSVPPASTQTALPPAPPAAQPTSSAPQVISSAAQHQPAVPAVAAKAIKRALLTGGIWKNEPLGVLHSPIRVTSKDATGVYFLTDVTLPVGSTLTHQWLHEGRLIYESTFTTEQSPATLVTSKLLNTEWLGSWEVVIKDSQGQTLQSIVFEVVRA